MGLFSRFKKTSGGLTSCNYCGTYFQTLRSGVYSNTANVGEAILRMMKAVATVAACPSASEVRRRRRRQERQEKDIAFVPDAAPISIPEMTFAFRRKG